MSPRSPLPRTALTGGGLVAVAVGVAVAVSVAGGPVAPTGQTSSPTATSGTYTAGNGSGNGSGHGGSTLVGLGRTANASLTGFSTCDALRDWYVSHAVKDVGPYGLGGPMRVMGPGVMTAASAAAAGAPAAPMPERAAAGSAATDASNGLTSATGTNVQVAGVDEADVAKRRGDLVLSVAAGDGGTALKVLRTSGTTATLVGRLLTLDWYPSQLLVDGDTVVLIGQGTNEPAVPPGPSPAEVKRSIARMGIYNPTTRIAEVDLSDPTKPRLLRTLDINGSVAGARLVDGVVRVAVNSNPRALPFVNPSFTDPNQAPTQEEVAKAEKEATAENQKVLRASKAQDWLPTYTLTENSGGGAGSTSTGELLDCQDVAAPADFAGYDTLSLVSFDLRADGLRSWRSAGVVASGATMYATADRTYLATSTWQGFGMGGGPAVDVAVGGPAGTMLPVSQDARTEIHAFDTSARTEVRYLGGGSVKGTLLNQFSMDEFQGDLRVATTVPASLVSTSQTKTTQAPSQSQVVVLRLDGDTFTQVGSVAGLGKGEQIYSVRFIGPVGYVVTFRRTDPLYTLDLSDPTAPKVVGELKILGYSAYLHPAGKGLLLGLGQDATEQGRVKGLQLSLFDVSDPASPRRISQVTMPNAWSDAEGDHHAFTFADGLVLLPYQGNVFMARTGGGAPTPVPVDPTTGPVAEPGVDVMPYWDSGVLAVRLQGERLSTPTTLRQRWNGPVQPTGYLDQALRTYVDNGTIWTVTTTGLGIHDADTLRRLGFVTYA